MVKLTGNATSTRWAIIGATIAAAAIIAALLASPASVHERRSYSCDGARVVVLDLSSQNRSERSVAFATEVMSHHVAGAAICDEPLTMVGVAGGGQTLIHPDVPFLENLRGPNDRARANVVAGRIEDVRAAVRTELAKTYAANEAVDVTSVPALFQAATALAPVADPARVVILSTGVQDEPEVSLNRPLKPGEGEVVSDRLSWPSFGKDVVVAMLGIAQMDGDVPVPGNLWPSEVMAFNLAACQATGATCELYQVAPVAKALL